MPDASVREVVVAHIKRLERGLMGDVEPVSNGVLELRLRWYKAFKPNAKPRYDTIAKVCGALGVRLVAQAIHA